MMLMMLMKPLNREACYGTVCVIAQFRFLLTAKPYRKQERRVCPECYGLVVA
jgi:hypothetical protein